MRRATDEQILEIKKLWNGGYSVKEICEMLKLSDGTVYKYVRAKESILLGNNVKAGTLTLCEEWDEVRMQLKDAVRNASKKKPKASHSAVFSWKESRKGEQWKE